jgi:hypothetical protein
MQKIDHRKTLKHLYHPSSARPSVVDVPSMNFLMIDGRGKPDGSGFQQAAQALFPLAYMLKFKVVRPRLDVDFHVMPMEVRWNVDRQAKSFAWTMMLMQPDFVSRDMFLEAADRLRVEQEPPAQLAAVRFEKFTEGLCVQLMHTGPYPGMDANLDKMIAFAEANGYAIPERKVHDIYLNDVRKTKPENLKAVMRLPVVDSRR